MASSGLIGLPSWSSATGTSYSGSSYSGFGEVTWLSSGTVESGYSSGINSYTKCSVCNCILPSKPYIYNVVLNDKSVVYCYGCARFNKASGGFVGFLDGILASVPFQKGTPLGIIADYLEDNGRTEAVNYLRKLLEEMPCDTNQSGD